MAQQRCFMCGRKMAENGLCSNADCVRSQPVPGTVIAAEIEAAKGRKAGETLAESGKTANKATKKS